MGNRARFPCSSTGMLPQRRFPAAEAACVDPQSLAIDVLGLESVFELFYFFQGLLQGSRAFGYAVLQPGLTFLSSP